VLNSNQRTEAITQEINKELFLKDRTVVGDQITKTPHLVLPILTNSGVRLIVCTPASL
jgi:hypothetical protein